MNESTIVVVYDETLVSADFMAEHLLELEGVSTAQVI